MNIQDVPLTKQVTWDEVRDEVEKVNTELCQIIDNLSPSKALKFVRVSYAFGDTIVKEGRLQLPLPSDADTSGKLKEYGLDYSDIPLALLLNKHSEVFIHENARIIPLKVFSPGMLFGTFETIDYLFGKQRAKLWSVSAGSKSIFALPKISENSGLRRLKNYYKISRDTNVLSLSDHWYLFKQIAQHENFTQPWESHVLFFTREWFKFKKKDAAWFDFQAYLFKNSWLQSIESMTRYEFALYWQSLVKAITYRRIQPTPYFIDSIRHIMLVAAGEAPAFQPAIEGDSYAPIQGIQEAIINVYMIEKYFPLMMHAEMFTKESHNPVYYSLAFPTLLEGSPHSKCSSSTIMVDIKKIKKSIETTLRDLKISKTLLDDKDFQYFHVEDDKENEILSSKDILKFDHRFLMDDKQNLKFCATSPFWRGCIMINNLKQ